MVDIINLIKDKGDGLLLRTETFNIIKILVKRLVDHNFGVNFVLKGDQK